MKKFLIVTFILTIFILIGTFSARPSFAASHLFSCFWDNNVAPLGACGVNSENEDCGSGFQSDPTVCSKISDRDTCNGTVNNSCLASTVTKGWNCNTSNGACEQAQSGVGTFSEEADCQSQCSARAANNPSTSRPTNTGQPTAPIQPPSEWLRNLSVPGIYNGNIDFFTGNLVPFVINLLIFLVILLSLIFLIIGAISFMAAGGNKEGTAKAKGTITYALIGLVLGVVSIIIVKVIGQLLGVDF